MAETRASETPVPWIIASFRFAGFFRDPGTPPLLELFNALADQNEAWTDQTNPKDNSRTITGQYAGLTFRLQTKNSRLSAVLSPNAKNKEHSRFGFPCIDTLPGDTDVGTRLSVALLGEFNNFHRVAVASTFVLKQPNLIACYRKLAELLPTVQIDPVGSRGFLYRINRPRVLSIGDKSVPVNRLVTWTAAAMHSVEVTIGRAASAQQVDQFGVHVQTDINTGPDVNIADFPLESKLQLLQSLQIVSTEIPIKGDIK